MADRVHAIKTDGISDEQKATSKFQFVYKGMLAQLNQPNFIPILCAHEAAHLVYFTLMGLKEYDTHPASIRYDPEIDNYVGDLAGVKAIDPPLWKEGKFGEWFSLFARACAAGGVIARKLDPSTDGGDQDDKRRFKAFCDMYNESNPKSPISFEENWKWAQEAVLQDFEQPVMMQMIEQQAQALRTELGL
jgi:hypothetical protein